MSEWAAIVYGRTYCLDFRFITVPQDFSPEDLSWASQYIVATTRQAGKLAGSPRWSLFKNARFCVVGVTTTVKDLIGDTVKDDRGRPLYIFVGYTVRLSNQQKISNLPPYSDNLDSFRMLYRYIKPVWSVKNYDPASRQPTASQYQEIAFHNREIFIDSQQHPLLNQGSKYAHKIYLWSNIPYQNKLLWQASSHCPNPTSVCLNVRGKALINSPFLNLSIDSTERFQILDRTISKGQNTPSNTSKDLELEAKPSLSQKIADRAKEDIDLTLQQANKMAIASQGLITNLADWNQAEDEQTEESDSKIDEPEFGFKAKKSSPKQDWF